MSNETTQKTSSMVDKKVETVKTDQFSVPTTGVIAALIVAFLVLKSFVYIKDKKRHGK